MKTQHVCYLIAIALWLTPIFCFSAEYENPLNNQDYHFTEASLRDYIRKAAGNKPERVRQAFEESASTRSEESMRALFADLWLGRNVGQVNGALLEIFTSEDPARGREYGLYDYWHLSLNQWLYRLYYTFGSKGSVSPGRIYPETEKALLEVLWHRMEYKDDILLTRQSTWWMSGSENHDIVAKVSSLITSQIFMDEPEYQDRVYPDLGHGGGYKYWFHSMYGEDRAVGPEPRGDYKDGNDYIAADHNRAWIRFFQEFFEERAKKGFFLEVASPHYMSVTVPYLTDVYDLCQDQAVAHKAEKFLDLVWADWAVDQINGVRGGAKTRVKDGSLWAGAMYRQARFYFGGEGSAGDRYFTQLLTSYELKPIIWEIALDREGLGEFAFISRKPGEEENVWPRPLGTERTMLLDTESRLVRYSWVTPDYILGCQMDHPAAVHSHLSVQARFLGITFKGENGPRIYPIDSVNTEGWTYEHALCRAVQDESVMLVQQARRFTQVNPEWYPSKLMIGNEFGIHFGGSHDRLVEKEGWIFIEDGDAFAAVRVVAGNDNVPGLQSELVNDSYTWNPDRTMIQLKNKYAGMIFETSRRAHHETLEAFMGDILDNSLILDKTVVAGFNILRYTGCGENAKEIYFNLATEEMSMIGERYVDYAPDMLFDSPYIKSKYNSGIVSIKKGGKELLLDFSRP